MNRTIIIRIAASLMILAFIAPAVIKGQDKIKSARTSARGYAPRVIGRSNSMIVEGRIVEIRNNRISIKALRNLRLDFRIDDQTMVLDSQGLVSIATMGDIALSVSDLQVSDLVEIVSEGAGHSLSARIITRIAESPARIASR